MYYINLHKSLLLLLVYLASFNFAFSQLLDSTLIIFKGKNIYQKRTELQNNQIPTSVIHDKIALLTSVKPITTILSTVTVPTISDFTPKIAQFGEKISITGSNLENTKSVTFYSAKHILKNEIENNTTIWSSVVDPTNKYIAVVGKSKSIKIYNLSTGTLYKELTGTLSHTNYINQVSFNFDATRLLSASDDGTVKLWNVETGKCIATYNHTASVLAVAFSPDGNSFASGGFFKNTYLWNINGTFISNLVGNTQEIYSIIFSPDGSIVASGGYDRSIYLWSTNNYSLLKILSSHNSNIVSLSFDANGKQLASASWDKTIKIWKVSDWSLNQTLSGHKGWVNSVQFSLDGKELFSASEDKYIFKWLLENGKIIDTIETSLNKIFDFKSTLDGIYSVSASETKFKIYTNRISGVIQSFSSTNVKVVVPFKAETGPLLLRSNYNSTASTSSLTIKLSPNILPIDTLKLELKRGEEKEVTVTIKNNGFDFVAKVRID